MIQPNNQASFIYMRADLQKYIKANSHEGWFLMINYLHIDELGNVVRFEPNRMYGPNGHPSSSLRHIYVF